MLQHHRYLKGHYLLNNKSILYILRRLVSHDQHGSPTVPHHTHTSPVLALTEKIPSSCHILIAGGGIIGQSVAYHLSAIGAKDIVLVEKTK